MPDIERYNPEEALAEAEQLQIIARGKRASEDTSPITTSEYQEASLDIEVQQEMRERPERLVRLRERVENLFPGEELSSLRAAIEESFNVPQFGEYHNEGMFMDTHLDLILKNIDDLAKGVSDGSIPAEARRTLQRVAQEEKATLERYTFLHDIAKKDSLTISFVKGKPQEVSWSEWQAQLPTSALENPVVLREYCQLKGIQRISYYHAADGGQHGERGKKALSAYGNVGVSAAVLTAIEKHEVAYQFQSIKPDTYQRHLGNLTTEEQELALVASYIDTAASLDKSGRPDLDNFIALANSRHNHEVTTELLSRLSDNSTLDQAKVKAAILSLRKRDQRIDESANVLMARLEIQCAPMQYDRDLLRQELRALAHDEVIKLDDVDIILEAIGDREKMASIGIRFGRAMQGIKNALQKSEK